MTDRILKLLLKRSRLIGHTGSLHSKRSGYLCHLTYDHLRMIYEILVHGYAILICGQTHPVRLDIHQPVTLLEKKNVGCYFCSGILLKSSIR